MRPVSDDDIDLLVAWHADPDVAFYWDGETFTRDEMQERLERSDVDAYVVEASGEPVGYIQGWTDEDRLSGGLDMFLVPSARGRGLGPDAAQALAVHLLGARGWTRVTVDPYLWNEAAVRAWKRAGFEPLDEHEPDEEHTASWLLMEFRG